MVVKILSSAGSFSGIEYNENKVSIGTAKLMAAENLGLLELSGGSFNRGVQEYQQYFKAWSSNVRGKANNPQFHVAISCKGREYNAEELKAIAEQYLDKMGYQNNPYLIYFHSDTANNHVHIVSSRVDVSGSKIKDSFERRRSQTIIKEILGLDAGPKVNDLVKEAMDYNFSSEAQFKLILEGNGITLRQKENYYQFIRGGVVEHEISKEQVDNKIKSYQEPEERIKQLKALFTKYKPALTPDKFSDFMNTKFGVEVIFHQAKGKDTPYGYSILDHSKGQVLKGSQVMKLSDLLTLAPRADRLHAGADLIGNLAEDDHLKYRDFKAQLSKLGFELNSSGAVRFAGEEQVSFTILKERMKLVMYNDRLFEAQKFTIHTPGESEIVGRVMGLKKSDFPREQPLDLSRLKRERLIISDKLNSLLSTDKDLGEIAKENNYAFAKKDGEVFLIDQKNHAIYKMADLTANRLDYANAKVVDIDRVRSGLAADQSNGSFGELAEQLLRVLEASTEQKEEPDQKKKRILHNK